MSLNKNQVYLLLIGLIIAVIVLDKSFYLLRAGFAEGVIVEKKAKNSSGLSGVNTTHTYVQFLVNTGELTVNAGKNLNYSFGEKVRVVYLKSDVSRAKIFSFSGYWFPGFTRGLFVFIILSGVVYAFIRPREVIVVHFKKPFSISKR